MAKWTGLEQETTNRNTGVPFACPSYPIKSVHVVGTFGGASVAIEGSNMVDTDGTVCDTMYYGVLRSPAGVDLNITDTVVRAIDVNTYWVRPRVVGGSATTSVDIWLLCVTER